MPTRPLCNTRRRWRVAFRPRPRGTGPQFNPNGSLHNIAGIVNKAIVGMMPHPDVPARSCWAARMVICYFNHWSSQARAPERLGTSTMPVSKEVLDEVALSEVEYQLIVDKLGREPTPVELGMFGSLWSEHCGYKHSRALLKLFPTSGKRVLCKAGEENAGAVDIGDGLVIVMKVESHNHPSAIKPFQGAAARGRHRSPIFTMGAFPSHCSTPQVHYFDEPQSLSIQRSGEWHRQLRQLPGHTRCRRGNILRSDLFVQPAGKCYVRWTGADWRAGKRRRQR